MKFRLLEHYYDNEDLISFIDKNDAINEYIDNHFDDVDIFNAWKDEWYPTNHTVEDDDILAEYGGIENITKEDIPELDIDSMLDDLKDIDYFSDILGDAINEYYDEHYDDLVDAFEWDNDPYGARGLKQSDFL